MADISCIELVRRLKEIRDIADTSARGSSAWKDCACLLRVDSFGRDLVQLCVRVGDGAYTGMLVSLCHDNIQDEVVMYLPWL